MIMICVRVCVAVYSKNNRISVFDTKTGEFVRAFGETFLSQPIAVTVSQDRDAVFVRDNEFDRVFVSVELC